MDKESESMSTGKIISFEERKSRLTERHNKDVDDVDVNLNLLEQLHERMVAIQQVVDPNVVLEWWVEAIVSEMLMSVADRMQLMDWNS